MISLRYSSLTSSLSELNVNDCFTHAEYDSLVVSLQPIKRLCKLIYVHGNCLLQFSRYGNVPISRHIFGLTCAVIKQRKVSQVIIPHSSFPLTHFFWKSLQIFFHFDNVDSTTLHLLIEIIESIEDIDHVCQNENKLRIFKTICMTMLVLSQ